MVLGSNGVYLMPIGSCLLKINEVQYLVASCGTAPAGYCLTDFGNGNRAQYVEPCPGG